MAASMRTPNIDTPEDPQDDLDAHLVYELHFLARDRFNNHAFLEERKEEFLRGLNGELHYQKYAQIFNKLCAFYLKIPESLFVPRDRSAILIIVDILSHHSLHRNTFSSTLSFLRRRLERYQMAIDLLKIIPRSFRTQEIHRLFILTDQHLQIAKRNLAHAFNKAILDPKYACFAKEYNSKAFVLIHSIPKDQRSLSDEVFLARNQDEFQHLNATTQASSTEYPFEESPANDEDDEKECHFGKEWFISPDKQIADAKAAPNIAPVNVAPQADNPDDKPETTRTIMTRLRITRYVFADQMQPPSIEKANPDDDQTFDHQPNTDKADDSPKNDQNCRCTLM